ncbi:C2H2-like zinc finger protein [Abeliophyllum distichum]|uniref:C2H2-like zinc finger protein n=1 Tax=Abeliophyllum distichum TaxID=126358 RepID=A0ABD1PNE6_9LAMI
MEDDSKELQLLSGTPYTASSSSQALSWPSNSSTIFRSMDHFEGRPSLDLQLSLSTVSSLKPAADCAEALKWQAAEHVRLAAMEKAYAERVKELTRREMEIAQSEFMSARYTLERAREEVDKAEKMKAMAIRHIDSTCREITCQSCRQKFRP